MTVRIIQVGLGGWGQDWARSVVPKEKSVTPVAWVEMDAETLAQAQKRLHLPEENGFTSLEQALEHVEADAVLITASLPGHVSNAITALKAGKHVLMEKPFAPTLVEARQVVDLATSQDRVLMISQNYRYSPVVSKVTELVREQRLGPVSSVNLDFRRYANNSGTPDTNRHYRIWQPLLVDMSIHHFDLMRVILGQEPEEVICKTWNPSWSQFVEDASAAATITFDGGTVVNYRGSWISPGPQTNWGGEWHMECENGEIVWTARGEYPEQILLRPLGKNPQTIKIPEMEYIDRSGTLHAFAHAVLSGEPVESSGRDNLKTLALMFAAIESARSGLPVDIARTEISV